MPPKGEKRVAPISSSAFSFSLGTPARKKQATVGSPARNVSSPVPRLPTTTASTASSNLTTPKRPPRPVSDLHPFTETPKRAQQALPLPSPFLVANPAKAGASTGVDSPKRQHRINDVLDASPFRVNAPGPRQTITAPPAVAIREKERVADAEDVGVSPRKFKGNIQYKGPGPPPSVRLAAILSSSNTAMVLFYTAQQHSVRSMKSATPVLAQLRTAPVRLEVLGTVDGRTHSAVMLRCRVRCWPEHPSPDTLLVVFQALPSDCPLVGIDPRVVASSAGKKYEVGLWSPWSTGPVMPTYDSVLFASRYLIAESVVV